jgi:hypothetical protein
MPTILAVGRDEQLLITRSAIFRNIGAEVVETNSTEAAKILKAKRVDLVVLCHTLTAKEMVEIASLAHQQQAGIRVLQLISARREGREPEYVDADAVAPVRPQALVAMVSQLLTH